MYRDGGDFSNHLGRFVLRLLWDDAYIFSVARDGYGGIVACRAKDMSDAIGKNIYKHLGMPPAEIDFFRRELFAYGKSSIATICERDGGRAVLFFKYFAYDTSLCLAVVLDMPVESVSVIMRGHFFDNFVISEGLRSAAPDERRFSAHKDKQTHQYLAKIIGQIEALSCLKLQRGVESVGTLHAALLSAAEFVGVDVECDVRAASDEELYFESPEIFDGRFCSACFFSLAMIARAYSRDRGLGCEIVGGFEYLRLNFHFEAFDDGWRSGVELIRQIALEKHNMDFGFDCHDGLVTVTFSPFYADVSFLGVKQDDVYARIEELGELY